MNCTEVISFVESSKVFGSKLGLDNIAHLMELLGNPQKSLKFAHIAGTNGKGSTASYLSNILTAAGYKTGLYTSPHIENFNERMRINGKMIDDNGVACAGSAVISMINKMVEEGMECPTEFEIVTAMAFVYFFNEKCDIVVLEVGLGGRLDCTNVIDCPEIAVITPINYDHTKELGATLKEIAYEKAGIIKQNGTVVSSKQEKEAGDVLSNICKERNAELSFADFESIVMGNFALLLDENTPKPSYGQTFSYGKYGEIKLTMLGDFQVKNAVVALTVAELLEKKGFNITTESIKQGLYNAKWNGRFEIVKTNPLIVIDGAHNPQGTNVLAQNLKTYFGDRSMLFIAGVLADKSYDEMLAPMLPLGDRFYTVTPYNDRALKADVLAKILSDRGKEAVSFESLDEALDEAIKAAKKNEIICCFGSLYYIGKARQLLLY